MNNLLQRAITGSIFVALIIGGLWVGTETAFTVITLFFILGVIEYFKLFKENKNIAINLPLAVLFNVFVFGLIVAATTGIIPGQFIFIIFPLTFLLFLTELWRKKENPLFNIGIMAFCFFYLVIPFYLMFSINLISDHANPLAIGMFLLIWTNDTFAYLTGRFLGKTKLFERISPKKTWEGTFGGIIFTLIVAYLIHLLTPDYNLQFWIIAACIIAPCSIFGDLLESVFKRSLNIKDSGNILPGHGGILDRFDAAIFVVPFFYCLVIFYDYL
jgi:phosphatidate cytidylyltransferase